MSTNPLSNMSYTNKDFQSIYVELLDLVKKLTYKWDPSISNESDPGVILLKLNAIIGDKNNYNIDKNILEAFPETLTQDFSARSLYKQLSYHMPWYMSATTDITFKWIGEGENAIDGSATSGISTVVKIPKFTMVTDNKEETIYTIVSDAVLTGAESEISVNSIEGTINDLTINGSNLIELTNIDSLNRIYFNDTNVAENGIFVKNISNDSDDYWEQVDNVYLQEIGTKCYEFGIDSRSGLCYLEFPQDIDKLIKNGISVKYILSNGSSGNIPQKCIDRFYQDFSCEVNGESKVLDDTMILLSNSSSSTNGKNPEDVDDAFINYRRTAGTFDTLVTLRDYMNAIYNSGLVSNVIVCDRLNDIQSTYYIVNRDDFGAGRELQRVSSKSNEYKGFMKLSNLYKSEKPAYKDGYFYKWVDNNMVVLSENEYNSFTEETLIKETPIYCLMDDSSYKMDAFDLKLYMMHQPGVISKLSDYNSTFNVINSNSVTQQNVINFISDQKCIQHNFKEIESDIPFLFKNYFQLNMKIIPYKKIESNEVENLKSNITLKLFDTINSRRLNFGEEANYDLIYDAILNSDERIKVLILDDFRYTTFAVYFDSETSTLKEVPISNYNTTNVIKLETKATKDTNGEVTDDSVVKAEIMSYEKPLGEYLYKNTNFVTLDGDIYKVNFNNKREIELYCSNDKVDSIRKDIIAKSILAGNTPLYNSDADFEYTIDQQQQLYKSTDRLTTFLEVCPFGMNKSDNDVVSPVSIDNKSIKSAEYLLGDNESIRFFGPSFTTTKTYANYVKFELKLDTTPVKREISLKYDDYVVNQSNYDGKVVKLYDTFNKIWYYDMDCNLDDLKSNTLVNMYNDDVLLYSNIEYGYLYTNNNSLVSSVFNMGESSSQEVTQEPTYEIRKVLTVKDIASFNGYDPNGYKFNALSEWRTSDFKAFVEEEVYTIPSNCDYRLKENESIVFYYKTEDSDEAPYTYDRYTEGTIISPTFLCYGNTSEPLVKSGTTGEIEYDESPSSDYQIIKKMYGKNDLSGTKEISIKNLVETTLNENDSYSYYFITNNIFTEQNGEKFYKMEPQRIEYSGGSAITKYRYILDNDEYFFHVNSKKTSFEMLGPGTAIIFDGTPVQSGVAPSSNVQLIVPMIDYVEIARDGLASFMNSLITIHGANVILKEQQIYNFSSGDTIIFYYKTLLADGKSADTIHLRTGEYASLEDYDIAYVTNGESGSLPMSDMDEENTWVATCCLNIDCSYDKYQTIHSNDNFSRRYIEMPDDNNKFQADSYKSHSSLLSSRARPAWKYNNLANSMDVESMDLVDGQQILIATSNGTFSYEDVKQSDTKPVWEQNKYFHDDKGYKQVTKAEYDAEDNYEEFYKLTVGVNVPYVSYIDYESSDEEMYINIFDYVPNGESPTYYDDQFYIIDKTNKSINPLNINEVDLSNISSSDIGIKEDNDTLSVTQGNPLYNEINTYHENHGRYENTTYLEVKCSDGTYYVKIAYADDNDTKLADSLYYLTDTPLKSTDGTNVYKKIYRWNGYYKVLSIDNPIYMMSSIPLNKVGGINVDVTYLDSNQEQCSPYIYIFTFDSQFVEPYFSKQQGGEIIIKVGEMYKDEETTSGSISASISNETESKYTMILPICTLNNSVKVKVTLGDKLVKMINPPYGVDVDAFEWDGYASVGTYYYAIEVEPNDESVVLTISWEANNSSFEENDLITVMPFYRCTKNDKYLKLYNIEHKDILRTVCELDENNIFNYVYKVDVNEYIEDPLNPLEFFNSYHFCNPFTIPFGDLFMSSSNGSNITMVNNR